MSYSWLENFEAFYKTQRKITQKWKALQKKII